ncbi:MAG: hypothetical protein KDA22_04110 [Phycisphaerales bacterium]|nr:hypothetical protein [Phycisphaerales bacterium]
MNQRTRRQHAIRQLLQRERIGNQEELRKRLRQVGIRAEQATLSRDLHALGVVKGPDGYVLPDALGSSSTAAGVRREELADMVQRFLGPVAAAADGAAIEHAGNLVVLRTGPGRAQPLALALDRSRLRGMLGTIAGDDTIFIAARTERDAGRLADLLSAIATGADESVPALMTSFEAERAASR